MRSPGRPLMPTSFRQARKAASLRILDLTGGKESRGTESKVPSHDVYCFFFLVGSILFGVVLPCSNCFRGRGGSCGRLRAGVDPLRVARLKTLACHTTLVHRGLWVPTLGCLGCSCACDTHPPPPGPEKKHRRVRCQEIYQAVTYGH